MAAVYLPTLNFSEKLSPISFCFNTSSKALIGYEGGAKLKPLKSKRRNRTLVCRAASSVAIRNLDADDFRHPLDRQVFQYLMIFYCSVDSSIRFVFYINSSFTRLQNTLILSTVPGLNEIGKALLGISIPLSYCFND